MDNSDFSKAKTMLHRRFTQSERHVLLNHHRPQHYCFTQILFVDEQIQTAIIKEKENQKYYAKLFSL